MYGSQTIERPFGLSVYGSSIIRVEPDIASLRFSASLLNDKPKDAFVGVQAAVKNIISYLVAEKYEDFGSSRITLESTKEYTDGKNRFVGYTACAEFHLMLRDLERLESLLEQFSELRRRNKRLPATPFSVLLSESRSLRSVIKIGFL